MLLKYALLVLSLTLPLFAIPTFAAETNSTPPLTSEQIPGMQLLIKTVQAMPIHDEEKARLLTAVQPTSARPYYRADASFLDPDQREALIKKYAALLGIPESQVTLFAVTDPDPDLKRTVLFPEFFALKPETAQTALLFHESLWLFHPLFYSEVVQAEAAIQVYLEHPDDPDTYFNFYHLLSQFYYYNTSEPYSQLSRSFTHVLLLASLQFDRSHGVATRGIPLEKIFGVEYLTGWLTDPHFDYNQDSWQRKLRNYYLTCSDSECPQDSLLTRSMKVYSMEVMNDYTLPELFFFDRHLPLGKTENAAAFLKDLVVNLNPQIDDHRFSFSLERNSRPVGRLSFAIDPGE